MNARLELNISGRVQGVNFRGSAKAQADKLGIFGYAKNLRDGTVNIIVEGGRDALTEFLHWCFRGPVLARVTGLKFEWKEFEDEFKEFTVIRAKNDFVKDQIYAFKNLGKNLITLPQNLNLPTHVAVICDGNRRWAKSHELQTKDGHKAGLENIVKISRAARGLGIKYLTLWAFSTENWKRDKDEVDNIMKLAVYGFKKYAKELHKDKVRFMHIGRKDRLPKDVLDIVIRLEEETKDYDKYYLTIALDYGGQDEILRAIKKASENGMDMENLSIEEFSNMLDTKELPDPDFIIRTSGEKRLSGLMPWQSTYAEFYFTNVSLPDFDEEELKAAILEYSYRTRRFGGNNPVVATK